MDKSLKMGPRADGKFEKCDLEQTKWSENGTLKVSDSPVTLS